MNRCPAPLQRRIVARGLLVAAAAVAFALAGCGDDKNPVDTGGGGTTPSTTFNGVLTNGLESGKLTVTVRTTTLAPHAVRAGAWRFGNEPATDRATAIDRRLSANAVTATGRLTIVGGATINLTGSYVEEADSLFLEGGGYTLDGHYDATSLDGPGITGDYSGPAGDGIFGCRGGAGVKIYCGAFQSDVSSLAGSWDMIAFADTALIGVAFPDDGSSPIFLEGTIDRTPVSGERAIAIQGGELGVLELDATGSLVVATDALSGSWTVTDFVTPSSDDGTWSGELCP